MANLEMKSFQSSSPHELDGHESSKELDGAYLARLGKKPVLKRNFGTLAVLGFSTTILITWEGIIVLFLQPLQNGGPAGAVWGFLFVWIGTACVFTVLAELASMCYPLGRPVRATVDFFRAPTSGGQYHWVSMLAPPSMSKFLSYITGWLNVIGWQAGYSTTCFLGASLIRSLVILTQPSYVPQSWHVTLLFWALTAFAVGINAVGRTVLPKLEGMILVVHVLGFFGALIALVSLADTTSAKMVFTEWVNQGGWSTQGLSFFVGIVGCVFAFAGGDAAIHIAEEVQNAPVVVPRAILFSVLINGALGFGMTIALLFCLTNLKEALKSPTGFPAMYIFAHGTGSKAGTATIFAIIIIVGACSITGLMAASSRQFWSFSRDKGIPGWRLWSKVTTTTAIPIWAVVFSTVVPALLALIPIGSSLAFNQLVAMSITGAYLSYMVVAILLLWRRLTGSVLPRSQVSPDETVNTTGAKLVWGPFHVPGIWGVLVNAFGIIYGLIASFFSMWPTHTPVGVQTMNFSVVGTFGTILLAIAYYVIRARHEYRGPIIETTGYGHAL